MSREVESLWGPKRKTSVRRATTEEKVAQYVRIKLTHGGYLCETDRGVMEVPRDHADIYTEEEAHRVIQANWLDAVMVPARA